MPLTGPTIDEVLVAFGVKPLREGDDSMRYRQRFLTKPEVIRHVEYDRCELAGEKPRGYDRTIPAEHRVSPSKAERLLDQMVEDGTLVRFKPSEEGFHQHGTNGDHEVYGPPARLAAKRHDRAVTRNAKERSRAEQAAYVDLAAAHGEEFRHLFSKHFTPIATPHPEFLDAVTDDSDANARHGA